ncbi:hypothetical protein ACFSYH_03350 [Populibacterium corticicola]|uniref:DUF3592 domain-containing protein n=1 Tax=Populibacterium corticicola TaxID=1812826 RepID=A0ABW5XAY0_9MICO
MWDALTAIGTVGAVVVALTLNFNERHQRNFQYIKGRGDRVQLARGESNPSLDNRVTQWLNIYNLSDQPIFEVEAYRNEISQYTQDYAGYEWVTVVPVIPPYGYARIDIDNGVGNIVDEVRFKDFEGSVWEVDWKAYRPALKSRGIYYEDRPTTLTQRLGALVSASTLRSWVTLRNFKSLGGLLAFFLAAVALFFAGFLTGNGI